MKRIFFYLFFFSASLGLNAQNPVSSIAHYLAGAVPLKNGMVEFEETFTIPEKTKAELFELLKNYTQKFIVEGENHLPQARITELSSEEGIIAASIEEYLWFKRKTWVWDRTQFNYQLIFNVSDGQFTVIMRRLRYLYEPTSVHNIDSELKAEDWITDKEALSRDGKKLTKVSGKKFRVKTIDRKEEIFKGAAQACGL